MAIKLDNFKPDSWKFWVINFTIKMLLAFTTRNMFYPDEHQQGVEIAYDMVYGGGNLTWEWDPNYALRPILHPLIYAAAFKLLNSLGLDYSVMIIYVPNIIHISLWLIGDYYMLKVCQKFYGSQVAKIMIFLNMTSWYSCTLMPRTFSNTIEASLLPMALYFWLKIDGKNNKIIDQDAIYLTVIICISFILRNTSIVPWLPAMMWKVFYHKTFQKFLFCGLFIAIPTLAGSCLLDSWYYGKYTLTAYNFLEFNVLSGKSSYFETNSSLNYILSYPLTQTLTCYPLLCFGMWCNFKIHRSNKTFPLLFSIFTSYAIVLSLIGHKESRFMLPLFYITCTFIALGIQNLLAVRSERLKAIIIGLKACIIILIFCSLFAWLHLNQYINLAYKANSFTTAFVSNQMSSKTLCDLHQREAPSSERIRILPWHPTFYTPSSPQAYSLGYLDKTGRDLQEKYMSMLLQQDIWNFTDQNLPEYLSLVSSANPITMKKTHKAIMNMSTQVGSVRYHYKPVDKYFVGIDDRRPLEGPKALVIEYLVVYRLIQDQ
ncbi:unnamed protein product [Moneuplotes crassus]|uniref:Mannosyltransferase n=1 Tax=Euplotes crassus TaxID=5936 RepID=A0AAD1UFV9_EUPCR|nr:unnamed protein product [Moneuplotes crassus]